MIIDGTRIAHEIHEQIKTFVESLTGRKPCLVVVLVGDHASSKLYVSHKIKACEKVGIHSEVINKPSTISEKELIAEIDRLNVDPTVDGILVQLPLPDHLHPSIVTTRIDPSKDVDGFHPYNVGKLFLGESNGFIPCTPKGIQVLLEKSGIDVTGKHVIIIGRSNIVGKPMAALLMQTGRGGNATVTIAHRHTQNLKALTRIADIIIVAIGSPSFLTADMVHDGAIVIDVGTNQIPDPTRKSGRRVVGDADFTSLKEKCSFITPVPGGVGPMTIAMLLTNTLESYCLRENLPKS